MVPDRMTDAPTKAFERELDVARRLAREAGALSLRYRDGGDLRVELKPGDEPVSIADKKCSELIVAGIAAAFPDDVVISEEAPDDRDRMTAARVWYIDPIDGTKDYIRGREGFAVMIGLCVDGVPVVGAVYHPLGDRLFAATPAGATFYSPGAPPRALHVSDVTDTASVRMVSARSKYGGMADTVKNALDIRHDRQIGSIGLKLALIALAEFDLYVNPSPRCKAWDTCAPEAILRAAGGRVTNVHGAPLRYDSESLRRTDGIVASNAAIHDRVIAKLAPVFEGR